MGTEVRCGRGEPHKAQEAGRRAQPSASMGLRSTRATARQREVSDGGTSNVSEPESLRKTCLLCVDATRCAPPWRQYTRTALPIPWLLAQICSHWRKERRKTSWNEIKSRFVAVRRRFNLYPQVEKVGKSVDFTANSAQICRECRLKKVQYKQEAFVPLYAPG
jgi:hypothetical protein